MAGSGRPHYAQRGSLDAHYQGWRAAHRGDSAAPPTMPFATHWLRGWHEYHRLFNAVAIDPGAVLLRTLLLAPTVPPRREHSDAGR